MPNPLPSGRRSNADAPGVRLPADEDRLLLKRVKERDQNAMAELFDRYSSLAYSVALRILNDPGHAEDLIQDVFFQIWQKPDEFVADRGTLAVWLAVVVRNRSIDALRRRKPSEPVENLSIAGGTDVASDLEREIVIARVRQVLKGLPTDQRKSLELAFFSGLTHAEIAQQEGEPLGTVKTRIRTALISLRKAFQT